MLNCVKSAANYVFKVLFGLNATFPFFAETAIREGNLYNDDFLCWIYL